MKIEICIPNCEIGIRTHGMQPRSESRDFSPFLPAMLFTYRRVCLKMWGVWELGGIQQVSEVSSRGREGHLSAGNYLSMGRDDGAHCTRLGDWETRKQATPACLSQRLI